MYTFNIKNNGPDINIVTTRAMLVLAAGASLVFGNDHGHLLNIIACIILLLAAIFVKVLIKKLKINKLVLLTAAAVLTFITTGSVSFVLILLFYGILVKFVIKKPGIEVSAAGISIIKFFNAPVHQWNEFNNVILKDNLLTVDFKNNKLLQLEIDETNGEINEKIFNNFCNGQLKTSN